MGRRVVYLQTHDMMLKKIYKNIDKEGIDEEFNSLFHCRLCNPWSLWTKLWNIPIAILKNLDF